MTVQPTMPSLRGGYIRPDEEAEAGFSSAALYLDERPFTFIPPSTFISHRLPLSPHTTREDIHLPDHFEVWRARDVVELDWATFVNYVLAEVHAEPDGKGHQSRASVATQKFMESRQKAEAVIAEWNEGFFGPRRIHVTADFSSSTSARTPSPSPSYRTIQDAAPFPAPNMVPHPFPAPNMVPHVRKAFPSPVNHQALAQSMQHIGRFRSGMPAIGHPPGFPFPFCQGPPVPFPARYPYGPATQPNPTVHSGDTTFQRGEQHGRIDWRNAQNDSDYPNYAHYHHPHHHSTGHRGNHRGWHHHHGGAHGGRHLRRSESTSSSSSSSSDSSISSVSSRDLEGADADDIRRSLAAFRLDPTKKEHIHTAVRQLHSELRSHKRGDKRERKNQSREVRTEIHNQKRAIKNEVTSLKKEVKSIRRSKKRERKAEKRSRKAQLQAQSSGLSSGMWSWRQPGGPTATSTNNGQGRSFEPATGNLGFGVEALQGQSQGVLPEHDLEREAAVSERRAEQLAIQLERQSEERERRLEGQAKERERRLKSQALERERQLESQALERGRQAEEREQQLILQQGARDLELEKSESQRTKQLGKAAEQRAKQAEQRIKQLRKAAEQRQKQEHQSVRGLEKAAENWEKEGAKLKQQADARAQKPQQEAENLRSEAARRNQAANLSSHSDIPTGVPAAEAPRISIGERARTLDDQERTLSGNNAEATGRALIARTRGLGRTVSQSAEERARGLGTMGEELGRDMQARGEEFGRGMQAWGEDFGRGMEEWGARFGKRMEGWGGRVG